MNLLTHKNQHGTKTERGRGFRWTPNLWRMGAPLLISACLLATPTRAHAQFSGTIQGTITDNSGANVPNATITLTNADTGVSSTLRSNGSGQYRVNSLAPGTYKLHVEASGFQTKDVTAVVTTSQVAGVDVALGLSGTTETVTVSSEGTGGLNPEENRVQTTLDTQQVRDLPLQNRGTLALVNTAPGVSGYTENTNNFAVEQTPTANSNGHYFGGNLYVLDGVSITSNITTGTANISPNADSLQEISLQVNTFDITYPGGSGLTTAVTTKAGANQFHGTGNFTYTDQNLRAHGRFQPGALPTTSNKDVSATFGGPIIKDRTFFFASVERLNNKTASTNLFTVESPEFINYARTAFPKTIGTGLLQRYSLQNGARSSVQLYGNPNFTQTCTTPTGTCNVPYITNAANTVAPYQHGLQYAFRGDQYFRQGKDRIYGYLFELSLDSQNVDPRANFNSLNTNRSWFNNINYTHIFSPNLLNEAQFASYKVEGANGVGIDPTIPLINVINAPTLANFGGSWGPGTFIQHNYSWRDVVSYVRGNHNFKFGVQAQHGDDSANFGPPQARPQFGFTNLTDLVQDRVFSEGNITYDPLTGNYKPLQFGDQGTSFGIYVSDQWKVASNLTLTLGLRWDDFGNPTTYGYQSYTKFANVALAGNTTTLNFSSLNAQFANASISQVSNLYPVRQNKNFTPRVGFAWQPTRNSTAISVHGGAGLYRDPITLGQVVDGLRTNPPGWITPFFSPTQPIQPVYSFGNSQTLPYGYVYPRIPATGLDARGGIPGAAANITGIDPNVKIPKTLNYTVGVSTQLPANIVLGINGVGSHAFDQLSGTDFNRFAGDLIANRGQLARLNNSFGAINYVTNLNTANYFGLVLTMTERLKNLNYQTSYTWSKSTDFGTCATRFDFNGATDCPGDQHNFAANFGPSAFDIRHNFKFSGSYTIPNFHIQPVVDRLVSGWEIASIATAQTGIPFSPTNLNPYDATCSGAVVTCGDYNADGYNNDRPNLVPGTRTSGFSRQQFIAGISPRTTITSRGNSYVVPTIFTAPAAGTLGNVSRNSFRNPGLIAIDASVLKNNAIPWFGKESANLQLRLDVFNTLNRVNLLPVDYNIGSSTFGQSTNTYQPRIMQLGARFQF